MHLKVVAAFMYHPRNESVACVPLTLQILCFRRVAYSHFCFALDLALINAVLCICLYTIFFIGDIGFFFFLLL